jgi:sec-independent protein translocase protein TatC
MAGKKDLFDDSVMTFGEHLEALRIHLIRALLGLAVGVVVTMAAGEWIIGVIRQPIDTALDRYSVKLKREVKLDNVSGFSFSDFWSTMAASLKAQFANPWAGDKPAPTDPAQPADPQAAMTPAVEDLQRTLTIALPAGALLQQLHDLDPQRYPAPDAAWDGKYLKLEALSDEVGELRRAVKRIDDPITLNVQEAFMTYLKVSLISGLILTSPWVFLQLWLFVAVGLYPHERKYVYRYLPMSIGLFLGGAIFCFYGVFPTVLDFLLGFNLRMGLTAQIRISEWINFAVLMPLLFGVSFQLPLVMLFLQKINVFQITDYREKRRLAILAIAFLAMLLTPTPDPFSMLLMMGPMIVLYELGIVMCVLTVEKPAAQAPLPA